MHVAIKKRLLNDKETLLFSHETQQSKDIGYISPQIFKDFPIVYVAEAKEKLAGILVAIPLSKWIKLGPFIILRKYQGKGLGNKLFTYVINKHKMNDLYISSSNSKVCHLAVKNGFSLTSFFHLPWEIKRYLFDYLLQRLNGMFIIDDIIKKIRYHRGTYRYFIKSANRIA